MGDLASGALCDGSDHFAAGKLERAWDVALLAEGKTIVGIDTYAEGGLQGASFGHEVVGAGLDGVNEGKSDGLE